MKKKNVVLMLAAEMLLLVLVFILLGIWSGQPLPGFFSYYLDIPSLLGILLITIPGLLLMGQFKDFGKALSVGQKHYSLLELKNILSAIDSCSKLVLYGGLVDMLIALVLVLGQYFDDPGRIRPYLAVIVLSGLYVVIFEYLLLPLRMTAQRVMNEEMDLGDEE